MLKEDLKQNIVLVLFCFLLQEYLTGATLTFVAIGFALVSLGLRPNKYVRNALALGVFASYWLKYGKLIDPEIGLNFLTSIITLKILEKETVRDRYMIFFGLLLLISAGSLFERTLTYVLFFTGSFLVLITNFYGYLGLKWRFKDLGLALLWVLPFTLMLFFLVPRLLNPIPFQQNTMAPGEIGYTPDVNISEVESLEPNQSPVFQVTTSRSLNQSELYWRANTLSYNDGWNWKEMLQDKEEAQMLLGLPLNAPALRQSFRLFTRPEYFFGMDYPGYIAFGNDVFRLTGHMKTLPQRRWEWVQKYDVYSDVNAELTEPGHGPHYLQVPLSKKEKESISNMFPGSNLEEVMNSIRLHFQKENFTYSLKPGRSASFREFLGRKIGFCSHYASAVALILRIKGIPTRLVSGFMGGEYNKFADFYLVSQNDAHVWVEVYSEGKWQRVDPTVWIAPDRVLLGGEAYMESVNEGRFGKKSFFKIPAFINDLRQWFGQWDFYFYHWLEGMDYNAQEAWLTKFKFKRKWLFSIIPIVMVTFMLGYIWFLASRKMMTEDSPHQDLLKLFYKKMNKRGVLLSRFSIKDSQEMMKTVSDPELVMIWDELIAASFQDKKISFKEMKRRIQRI